MNAGGIILYEIGTPDMGLGSAGWAARAEDPGTAFTNPAGMTRFKNREVMLGVQPLYQYVKFDPDSQTTVKGKDGNASTWMPAGGFYSVAPINKDLSVGAAVLSYFGSSLNYGGQWVGRYYLDKGLCMGFSFVPGIAYRINDCLSVGISANVMYSVLRTYEQINNALDQLPDGSLKLTGKDWGVGVVLGVLYERDEWTRFGVQYVSEVRQKYNMKPNFRNIGPTLEQALQQTGVLYNPVSIACNIPNWLMFSMYKRFTPCVALMGNIGWQQWSGFGRAQIQLDSPTTQTLSAVTKFEDTWHVALGAEYTFCQYTKATFGIAYDSSAVTNKNRTVTVPVGKQWRFGSGYQYEYSECLKLSGAYELMWSGDLKIFQSRGPLAGTISGKFNNLCVQLVNLSAAWSF